MIVSKLKLHMHIENYDQHFLEWIFLPLNLKSTQFTNLT